MLTLKRNTKVATALNDCKGNIYEILCKMAMIKKYKFASLRNCMNKLKGRKVIRVYLVVLK